MKMVSKNSNGEYMVGIHMNITLDKIIIGFVILCIGIIGFFLSKSIDDIDSLQDDVKKLPEKYVLKTDYNRTLDKLDVTLNTIQKDIKQLLKEQN